MDWKFSIERNREPLVAIVAALYAMIGLAEGGMLERLSRPLYRKVLQALRPAEAAVRRLIIAAAHGLEVKPPPARAKPEGRSDKGKGKGKSQRRRLFRLFDLPRRISGLMGRPRPKRRGPEPRIHMLSPGPRPGDYIDVTTGLGLVPSFVRAQLGLLPAPAPPPAPPAAKPDDTVSALSLCRRLAAISDALNDLPRQAMRYARWKAKPYDQRRPKRYCALRTGPPPYLRKNSRHEVHDILSECHWLARTALKPDTS
jgi:hypothetical protein